ncbi:MAG: tetratricopeptide repeat protein [Opitutaceae bacterium]
MRLYSRFVGEGLPLDLIRIAQQIKSRGVKPLLHLCAVLLLLPLALNADSFTDGISAYENGEYETAIKHFEATIADEETAAARHNLALSYFQLGQPAEAAWQIERALRIDPINTEYHYKLGALRQQVGLFESRPKWHVLGAQLLSTSTWILLCGISFWLLLAAWILPSIANSKPNLFIKAVRLTTVIIFTITLPALWLQHSLSQSGIVISNEPTDLHAAPASAAPATGVARPGERARIVDQFNDFYQIETEAQITGWISKTDFRALKM